MDALLIAPARRAGMPPLDENEPLALLPILGKPLAAYWLEHLVARGIQRVRLLASDRVDAFEPALGDGSRWGVRLEIISEGTELSLLEAQTKYAPGGPADAVLTIVMDRLPDQPQRPLFESQDGWFAALAAWIPRAATPDRIGAREIAPGVWLGLHSHMAPGVRFAAPCWIGENVRIGAGAVIGPQAILEDRVLVGGRSIVVRSVIGPDTCVGDLVRVENSVARHDLLLNWSTGSSLHVPDAFLLSRLPDASPDRPPLQPRRHPWTVLRQIFGQPKAIALPAHSARVTFLPSTSTHNP